MDWKNLLTPKLLKSIGREIYNNTIYPAAKAYVDKTDNKWDDKMLEFLDGFIDDALEEKA